MEKKVEQKVKLKRVLGLFEVTLSGLGIILGAGIYTLIGEAANLAGNALWISFILAALVALITGMSYAELASLFPKARQSLSIPPKLSISRQHLSLDG